MNNEQKLAACSKTRKLAAQTLVSALTSLLSSNEPISEQQLINAWLANLRKNPEIYPDGWYMPPPHGMSALFGSETDFERVNYKSLRPKDQWSKPDIFLDREKGVAYVFASPVDRVTGMIGDFGLSLYFGSSPKIINHFKNCWRMNQEIFAAIEVGMSLAQIAQFADALFKKNGFANEVTSTTDPIGVDIGHTLPASYADWSDEETAAFRGAKEWDAVCKLISTKRVFLNPHQSFVVRPGMAMSLEPRLTLTTDPTIPMASFHTIVLIHENGTKELLTNFTDVFNAVGMDFMGK